MEKHNIIFLDIDGVLNNLAYHEAAGKCAPEIEERALKILADIYKESNCRIVLASSWRELDATLDRPAHSMYQYLLSCMKRYDMEIIGKTPYIHMDRPAEIAEWIKIHEDEIRNFIILDDDYSPEEYDNHGLKEHLIQTIFFTHDVTQGGLQERHKEKAKKILKEAI